METGSLLLYLAVLYVLGLAAVMLSWGICSSYASWAKVLAVVGVVLPCLLSSGTLELLLLCTGCSLILYNVGRKEKMLTASGKSVLITGCDSGFGHNLAKMLAQAGMKVYAGVLKESGPGAEELRRVSSSQLTVLQLDVTDIKQITAAHQLIKSQTGDAGLWGLVNNAGVLGYLCDGEILPMRILRTILNVNFIAGVEVGQVFLPMIRHAKGRIINVSSLAGEVPFPGFAAYGASKAALTMFFGSLRQELSCWGVKVAIIQPGGFKTNILGNQEEWREIQKETLRTLPEEVIKAYGEDYICSMENRLTKMSSGGCTDFSPVLDDITHALLSENPKPYYYPGKAAWSMSFLHRIFPTWLFDALFSKLFKQGSFKPAGVAQ